MQPTSHRIGCQKQVIKVPAAILKWYAQALRFESAQVFRDLLRWILQAEAMSFGGFIHFLGGQIEQVQYELIRVLRFGLKLLQALYGKVLSCCWSQSRSPCFGLPRWWIARWNFVRMTFIDLVAIHFPEADGS